MSLSGKIIFGFCLSSVIIATFLLVAYIDFVEIRREIRYLELSDSLRSKTLQFRRHEKNFFLYRDIKELEEVHNYIKELKSILGGSEYVDIERNRKLKELYKRVDEYEEIFKGLEASLKKFQQEFERLKPSYAGYREAFPLIESSVLERPLVNAEAIEKMFSLGPDARIKSILRELDTEILALRKTGEEILAESKVLDKQARERVERNLSAAEKAGLILFPLFFVVGISVLLMVTGSIIRRLKLLTGAVKKAGKGDFLALSVMHGEDEIGQLIREFNRMEENLIARDKELGKKSEELLQTRKLAAIGTLASGVAHELNNPLNNIYLAAQMLSKEVEKTSSVTVKETVGDIFNETLRVKRIVGDLLSFAREKPLNVKKEDIAALIKRVVERG